jgi:3-hexulose-6-phosphate synthase
MKLHFTYNVSDLSHALKVAEKTAEFADIIGVGSLLLLKEGVKAVKSFKTAFPNKEIFAEAKITEKAEDSVTMLAQAGASYISVLAGTFHSTIKKAVNCAQSFDVKIALDLLDASSFGQSAMDAKTLGVNVLILHRTPGPERNGDLQGEWESVRANTNLPIFVTGKIDESNFQHILGNKPQGIMIGSAITKADNPAKAAHFFKSLL